MTPSDPNLGLGMVVFALFVAAIMLGNWRKPPSPPKPPTKSWRES